MGAKQTQHSRLKREAAGSRGRTEKRQPGGTRLDAKRGLTATEIERSGRIRQALNRLAKESSAKKLLRVPQKDLDRAAELAREVEMAVTVTNLSGSKRRIIKS